MIVTSMARKLVAGARDALGTAAGMARHLIWYFTYQVDGTARTDEFARRQRDRS
jgi:hypothetical protein